MLYIYIYIYVSAGETSSGSPRPSPRTGGAPTANLGIKILDFRGFDSSTIFIIRGGILMSIGSPRGFPGKFESSDLSRENLSREIGPTPDQRGRESGSGSTRADSWVSRIFTWYHDSVLCVVSVKVYNLHNWCILHHIISTLHICSLTGLKFPLLRRRPRSP